MCSILSSIHVYLNILAISHSSLSSLSSEQHTAPSKRCGTAAPVSEYTSIFWMTLTSEQDEGTRKKIHIAVATHYSAAAVVDGVVEDYQQKAEKHRHYHFILQPPHHHHRHIPPISSSHFYFLTIFFLHNFS